MANTNQARKRARQADARREHNSQQRSALRTEIKKFRESIANNTASREQLSTIQSHLDKAAKRGLIPKNRAKRIIQRLNQASKAAA